MLAPERLAGLGLAIAAVTILTLALVVLTDLDREAELNREVISAQQAKDSLASLSLELTEMVFAARLVAATGAPESAQHVERRAVEAEADLAYLRERETTEGVARSIGDLAMLVKGIALHARSIAEVRRTQGPAAAQAALEQGRSMEEQAAITLDRAMDELSARLNARSLEQIRIGEGVRQSVTWLLAGSAILLVALFAAFIHARTRERHARHRIEHLAQFDSLTDLPNRSLLADRLRQEVARSQRAGREFALMLFDLDGFKQVNDTAGHAAGDEVLKVVAERVREALRASDTVGRLGGDEFLAILPETGREGALGVAEKLREALSRPYSVAGRTFALSVSVGISVFNVHSEEPEALQRMADAALYEAKHQGKNRVRVAPDPAFEREVTPRTAETLSR